MGRNSEPVEIEGTVERETAAAVLIDTGRKGGPEWIPKSQILSREEGDDGMVTLEIPEWIAVEKGLV